MVIQPLICTGGVFFTGVTVVSTYRHGHHPHEVFILVGGAVVKPHVAQRSVN